MPEHLRVFVIILAVAVIAFSCARFAVTDSLMDPADFRRRRNVWFALTALAFLSHNFWIFIVGTLILAFVVGRRENNVVALYLTMLIAVPGFSQPLPGFAGINFLFDVDHERMLALGLLLPAAIQMYRKSSDRRDDSLRLPDRLVACYVLWVIARFAMDVGFTEIVRAAFYELIDVALPYYVASRYLRSVERFREAMAAFVIVAVIAGAIATFEWWRHWLLYTELRPAMGLPLPSYIIYLERLGTGMLRAQSSLLQPIVVGYVMMIALAMLILCSSHIKSRGVYFLAMASIAGGLIGSLSRGPWVGTAAMLMTIVALDPSVERRVSRFMGASLLVMIVIFATPIGSSVIELLPWVGSVEASNIDYRSRLFDVSIEVIKQNPWFGDLAFLENPLMEQMRQGQGIIDVVNSYLEVALPYGIIGLAAFVAPFVVCLMRLRRTLRDAASLDADSERLGRTLLAMMVGVLTTIATVSGIGVIPQLYWILLGMCFSYVAYMQAVRRESHAGSEARQSVARARTGRRLSEGY